MVGESVSRIVEGILLALETYFLEEIRERPRGKRLKRADRLKALVIFYEKQREKGLKKWREIEHSDFIRMRLVGCRN